MTLQTQTLLTHHLANGLQIVGCPMPDAESVAVAYFIRTGARDEHDPALEGVSHFLEHILFKGTKMLDRQQLDQAFTRVGAKRNGFTSFEYTVYYVQVLSEYLSEAFDLLSAMMYPRFLESEFEAEKEVILNEIARVEDRPQTLTQFRLMRSYFGDHPLGKNVLGSPESIRAMTLEQMRTYWQHRYVAPNVIISIAGKFAWEPFVLAASRYGTLWQSGQVGRQAFPYEPAQARNLILTNPQLKQQNLMLAMPMVEMGSPDFEAAFLGASMLGRAQGSRLYWQIVHKGLAASASASLWAMEGTGLLLMRANTTPDNAPEVLVVLRAELALFLEKGATNDELSRAKALWIGDILRNQDFPYSQMWSLALDWVVKGRLVSREELIERIENVTMDDVLRVFHRFPLRKKQIVTTYGPLSEASFSW
ncbi:MAG TPA: pitrilysin family protein [Ktedonobacteraceae bacterium]|nr:pitrilysin family protein [Ktedonobacteraceae bacterium]